jgi:hypothetical protein
MSNSDGNGLCHVSPSEARNEAKVRSRSENGWLQKACDVMSQGLNSRAGTSSRVASLLPSEGVLATVTEPPLHPAD